MSLGRGGPCFVLLLTEAGCSVGGRRYYDPLSCLRRVTFWASKKSPKTRLEPMVLRIPFPDVERQSPLTIIGPVASDAPLTCPVQTITALRRADLLGRR